MKSVYVHINPLQFSFSKEFNHSHFVFQSLPEYATLSIKQTEHFLQECPEILVNDTIDIYKKEIEEFFYICKKGMPSFYRDPFWFLTLLRLYVVYLHAKKNNIKEFVHLEYDNLIFSNLCELKKLPPSVYFTRVGPSCSSGGFVYCNSLEHFELFFKKIDQMLNKGENIIRHFTQYSHLSEMILIDIIAENTKNIIDFLPITPVGPGSENFELLNSLFDCASYGQYLGGTNNGDGKGWYGQHHYIGQQIQYKNIEVFMSNGKPFVKHNSTIIPVHNLHIHSKRLKDFTCL